MPTHIRLSRVGRNKQGSFRIVVSDSSHARDGRNTEQIGHYNARPEPSEIVVDEERALHWLREGAVPTSTVLSLFKKTGLWKRWRDEKVGRAPAEAAPAEEKSSES